MRLLVVLWISLYAQESGAKNHPLILVPGVAGSAIEVKEHDAKMPHPLCQTDTGDEWLHTWASPAQALPYVVDCLITRLTLTYDPASQTYANLPGIQLRAAGWKNGTVAGKGGLDLLYAYQYHTMLEKLRNSHGYELGVDVFIAPYDWRLAFDSHAHPTNGVGGYYEHFKKLVEEAVQKSGEKAVVLSHSLGGPTMLYFFHTYVSPKWRAQHIHGWVALAAPWMGAATPLTAYLGGWNLGLPKWLIPHDYVKRAQVNLSSCVLLSPHPKAFRGRDLIVTPSRTYSAADIPDMVRSLDSKTWGNQTALLFPKLRGPWAGLQFAPENVPLHNWYGTGVDTAEGFVYDEDLGEGFNKEPKETLNGPGDGLVNLVSLQHVDAWPKSSLITSRNFSKCTHFGILSDARVLDALAEYLPKPNSSAESEIFV